MTQPEKEADQLDYVGHYLEKLKLKFKINEQRDQILLGLRLQRSGSFTVSIRFLPQPSALVFDVLNFAELPEGTSGENRLAVLQKLLSINYKLLFGAFGYDPTDGEIRLSYGYPLSGGSISEQQFRHALMALLSICKDLYPDIMSTIFPQSQATPLEGRRAKECE